MLALARVKTSSSSCILLDEGGEGPDQEHEIATVAHKSLSLELDIKCFLGALKGEGSTLMGSANVRKARSDWRCRSVNPTRKIPAQRRCHRKSHLKRKRDLLSHSLRRALSFRSMSNVQRQTHPRTKDLT